MKIYITFIILSILFIGCTNIQTIPTAETKIDNKINISPISPEEVLIYRSSKPADIEDYKEIGIVVLRGENPEIDKIYKLIRKEASKQGAKYVLDFKLKGNLESRSRTTTSTSPEGVTTTSTQYYTVIAFTATGTLFTRR